MCMLLLSGPFHNDSQRAAASSLEQDQSLSEALKEAGAHVHYWLLIAGFFVCGFQLAFITVHMPAYLSDNGFEASVAVVSLSLIGLFNIFGCLLFGSLSGKYSKKNLLGLIYLLRAVAIAAFMIIPMSTNFYLPLFYCHWLFVARHSTTYFGYRGANVWFKTHG